MTAQTRTRLHSLLPVSLPLLIVLAIWLSPLAFVPVPWPDDSAFYFVGREFWKWPPRWVMLPQAPFEPSYRIHNFNTMPLYPMLIGLGRLLGIDGSFALKFWPLSAFALTGSLLGAWLFRAGLPAALAALVAATLALDPAMRWASVLVRPESLIGLCGLALVLGTGLGFPERFRARGLWDPAALLLAASAYTHFNAIHLLFPVVLGTLAAQGWRTGARRLAGIAARTALYLVPWLLTVAWRPGLFIQQMQVQWNRLAVPNAWLSSVAHAVGGIFQDMGSPEPWPAILRVAAYGIWVLMLGAIATVIALAVPQLNRRFRASPLVPAAGWVLGSSWLWHSKPEVWFTYYLHASVWTFAGVAALEAWRARSETRQPLAAWALGALAALTLGTGTLFAYVNVTQAARLGSTRSWNWDTHRAFIDCIDARLQETERRLGNPRPFRVWCPTFPDVTVELSRRHPEWELTRTNDFWDRAHLAIQHGRDTEAVVVTETINWIERDLSAPQSEHPEIHSAWMTWNDHFLNHLWREPGWKPNRFLCQRGRWQAFIFEK